LQTEGNKVLSSGSFSPPNQGEGLRPSQAGKGCGFCRFLDICVNSDCWNLFLSPACFNIGGPGRPRPKRGPQGMRLASLQGTFIFLIKMENKNLTYVALQ